MIILSYILSGLSLLMSVFLLVPQPKFPLSFYLLFQKLIGGALSPYYLGNVQLGASFDVAASTGLTEMRYRPRSRIFTKTPYRAA